MNSLVADKAPFGTVLHRDGFSQSDFLNNLYPGVIGAVRPPSNEEERLDQIINKDKWAVAETPGEKFLKWFGGHLKEKMPPSGFKDLLLRPGQEGSFGPIGTYNPETDKSELIPLS